MTEWIETNRADPIARDIADRHYNRQKIGAEQFVPPGRCLVLVIPGAALWITSWPFAEYVKHAWPGAWVCSAFRNERPDRYLSSTLITQAIAATRDKWSVPDLGMITFVDPSKTKRKRDPGRCFRKAGFQTADPPTTMGGLVALQLRPDAMPLPAPPPTTTAGTVFVMRPTDDERTAPAC